ncbi:MAG: hypothetical protein LBE82_03310, partial [Chitinophagaceae bacterium]|nr:hypothetical protein [Chitinophagaceae bacterium]
MSVLSTLSLMKATAQDIQGNINNLISLTTQSTLKLEVIFQSLPIANAQYRIKITGKNGELYNATVTPSAVIQEQHKLVFNIKNLRPQLWYPANPVLYQLSFIANGEEKKQNIGFRFIESKNGNIYLNGKPIFLRGIAINPPDRGIPDSIEKSRKFAEDYVSFMKSIHVNIIRIPNNDTWYDVCDELGMMVFGGNYGGSVDGQKPPTDYEKAIRWYQNDAYAMIAHHPSLMIYAMTNETPYNGSTVAQWEKFLSYAADKLKAWDSTRLYIANAGYGYGKAGDICDLHRYWGWYYSSPFTFLHIRNNEDIIPFKKKVQPVTFTECVGNYSGPDGRYNLTPDHKNPGSQLNWTGHASNDLQAQLANEHQCFTFKQATEMFRRLRTVNPELSGVFPFTILFYNWHTIQQFVDMDPKPVTQQARLSYSPVLVSWENWNTQAYAGATIKPILHIVNDDDNFSDLDNAKFVCQVLDETKNAVYADTFALPHIAYYGTYQKHLSISLPAYLVNGNYQLTGKILKGNTLISENFDKLYIAGNSITASASKAKQVVLLYDPTGKTAASFSKLGITFNSIVSFKNIAANSMVVIGENSVDNNLVKEADAIKQFVATGGRVLILRQDSLHFPTMNSFLNCPLKNVTMDLDIAGYPPPPRPSRNGYYVNPERPDHPVFSGIKRENLRVWADYTDWNESNKTGFPANYP